VTCGKITVDKKIRVHSINTAFFSIFVLLPQKTEIMPNLWKKILPGLRNKYILTLLVFFIWILFFDQNNLVDRFVSSRNIRQLERDKKYFIERIKEDSTRLNQLRTDNDNLEKFAREQYLMKRENEEIFIIEFED